MVPVTRVALVGLGGIAQSVHLPVLQRHRGELDLAALVEVSPSRLQTFADRYGVAHRYATVEALVAAVRDGALDVDAAILATSGDHAAETLALVAGGIRVLVEKPLAYSHDSLDRLRQGLERIGCSPEEWLRVGYMKEYDPAVAEAKQALDGAHLREVAVTVLHPADAAQLKFANLAEPPTDVPDEALAPGIAGFQESLAAAVGDCPHPFGQLYSGVMLGSVIHDVALTRHLGLGLERVIHARHWTGDLPGSVTALGVTRTDVPWTLAWHYIPDYPEYSERVTVHHERGTVELEFRTPYVLNAPTTLRLHEPGKELEHELRIRTWPQEEAFERELHALIRLAHNDPIAGSSLAEAEQDLAAAQALWRACVESAGIVPSGEAAGQRDGRPVTSRSRQTKEVNDEEAHA